jgi:arylsulfatase A-like enzyme/Tfp pilus assembly protein PilF
MPVPRNRLVLLQVFALGFIHTVGGCEKGTSGTRGAVDPKDTSVLLITLDTTRADALGCYGNSNAKTPVLDGLAKSGRMFSRCTTSTSITLPAHASIMTGTWPFVHGVRRNAEGRLSQANDTLAEALKGDGFFTGASVGSFVLHAMFGLDQGFDAYSDVSRGANAIAIHAERPAAAVTHDALTMLESVGDNRFFLWVHYYDAHYPYISDTASSANPRAAYQKELESIDAEVGRLLASLKAAQQLKKTLVIVVGDHGEAFAEHGEYQHGYFTYETTLHVPLIFSMPGTIASGPAISDRVRTIDVLPTVCEFVGVEPPSRAQGASLASVLYGTRDSLGPPLPAYGESVEGHAQLGLSILRSVHVDRWKYIHAPQPELYDLHVDPDESRNVASEETQRVFDMRALLRGMIAESPETVAREVVQLDRTEIGMLQSLGYVGGVEATSGDSTQELDHFEPQGDDPKAYAEIFRKYSEAHWAMVNRQPEFAVKALRDVLDKVPDAVRIRTDLAYSLQQLGQTADAIAEFKAAIAQDSEDAFARRLYGGLLIQLRRWPEAAEQLTVAVAEQPDDLEAWYNLGVAAGSMKQFAKAERCFLRAVEIDEGHVSALHALGVALMHQGKNAAARERFEAVLRLAPDHPRARSDLAKVSAKLDD